MMCPSTWASSVETWVRLNSQRRTPTASRPARAIPITAKAIRLRPPGRGAGVRASGAAADSRRNPVSDVVCASGLVTEEAAQPHLSMFASPPRGVGRASQFGVIVLTTRRDHRAA